MVVDSGAEQGSGASETNSDSGSGAGAATDTSAASGASAPETGLAGLVGKIGKEGAGSAAAVAGGLAGGQAAPAFTPNFKYKVLKEEKEIPEWARSIVTSPETEKSLREIFEKSDGIDVVKTHRDQLVGENEAMRREWGPVVQNVQTVVGHLQRGDLDSFFESVNIPESQILKYALYRLQLKENPQQFAAHEQTRQMQLQNLQLQQELQASQTGYQNMAVQTRANQLDNHLARAEILPAVQSFDQRVGTPGAFRTEIIKRGKMYAAMGQDASVEQLAAEVLQLSGWQPQAATAAVAAPVLGNGLPGQAQAKPTLPNVRGRGTSPTAKVFRSTDELRKHARQLA